MPTSRSEGLLTHSVCFIFTHASIHWAVTGPHFLSVTMNCLWCPSCTNTTTKCGLSPRGATWLQQVAVLLCTALCTCLPSPPNSSTGWRQSFSTSWCPQLAHADTCSQPAHREVRKSYEYTPEIYDVPPWSPRPRDRHWDSGSSISGSLGWGGAGAKQGDTDFRSLLLGPTSPGRDRGLVWLGEILWCEGKCVKRHKFSS